MVCGPSNALNDVQRDYTDVMPPANYGAFVRSSLPAENRVVNEPLSAVLTT